jgi:hypothetical protein
LLFCCYRLLLSVPTWLMICFLEMTSYVRGVTAVSTPATLIFSDSRFSHPLQSWAKRLLQYSIPSCSNGRKKNDTGCHFCTGTGSTSYRYLYSDYVRNHAVDPPSNNYSKNVILLAGCNG